MTLPPSTERDVRADIGASSARTAVPYVLPMVALLFLLSVGPSLGLGPWEYPIRTAALTAVLLFASRRQIDLRVRRWAGSTAVGLGVFAIWIGPDVLWPSYRESWLLQGKRTGTTESSVPEAYRHLPMVVVPRAIRATILVPIIEELFWRAWLMRWLINPRFLEVPLGTFRPYAFFATAALFATVHGAYWDVALAAGLVYNAWLVRTRSLGDCIWAHAVTNGVLSVYVVALGQWQYW